MGSFTACAGLAAGLAATVWGGGMFVDAAVALSRALGLPRFLIGATVVSLATTLPEVLVSLTAAGEGATDMACGNAVGSVSANLGLILGLALFLAPAPLKRGGERAKLLMMAGAAGLLYALSLNGALGPLGAAALLALFAAFLVQNIAEARARPRPGLEGEARPAGRRLSTGAPIRFVAGAAAIALGARLLTGCGAALARLLGTPEGVVGATLVAVGTSLPELATALAALSRGQESLSVGNVVGANIIDLTLILPLCAVRSGGRLALPVQSAALDLPFCLALALIAALPPLVSGRFSRAQGGALLAVYGAYLGTLLSLRS